MVKQLKAKTDKIKFCFYIQYNKKPNQNVPLKQVHRLKNYYHKIQLTASYKNQQKQ